MKEEYWSGSDLTFDCLADKKRTSTLQKIIHSTVSPNDIVVDLGSGTGILSIFAAESGAKRIYAVENDKNICKTLEDNLNTSKYSDKIIVIKKDARIVKLPEKVDVIICEMVSTGLIDELQIPVLNNALKFLKKNGKVIPQKIRNFVDLVYSKNKFYGIRLNTIRYEYPWRQELRAVSYSDKFLYKEVDFTQRNGRKVEVRQPLKINKNGGINGVRISNKTIFSDGSEFSYSGAYCIPLILPVEDRKVKKGEEFHLEMSYQMCKGIGTLKYSLTSYPA